MKYPPFVSRGKNLEKKTFPTFFSASFLNLSRGKFSHTLFFSSSPSPLSFNVKLWGPQRSMEMIYGGREGRPFMCHTFLKPATDKVLTIWD